MAVTMAVCGAAGSVTGMCLHLATGRHSLLIDCGLFQGPKALKALNYEAFPFDPAGVDAVLLTHAHIDHSGLLPKLVKQGFRGRIHATQPTIDLCSCLLPDSGHIQESEVAELNRRNRRRGRPQVQPIYTAADAERALERFLPVPLGRWIAPLPGVRARFWNAGHMLGSASIELAFEGEGEQEPPIRLLVSGDIGSAEGVLQRASDGPAGVDHMVLEATYGDQDRPPVTTAARRAALARLLRLAAEADGALLVPVFAVERAQEVVTDLIALMRAREVPEAPIHLDSPLASRATRVFLRHAGETGDPAWLRDVLTDPLLRHVEGREESLALSRREGFRIVLAGSGMCEAGRIRQHLAQALWDPATVVALVGFQAQGTLGRLLQDGERLVRIQGEAIRVAARIERIEGYSGHADAPELLRWAAARGPVAGGLFLVHGEPGARDGLAQRIAAEPALAGATVLRPLLDEAFRLRAGTAPEAAPGALPRRRAEPETVMLPDWHNARSALLLAIDEALEQAPDEAARAALLARLRAALAG